MYAEYEILDAATIDSLSLSIMICVSDTMQSLPSDTDVRACYARNRESETNLSTQYVSALKLLIIKFEALKFNVAKVSSSKINA